MNSLTESVDMFTVAQAGEVAAATSEWYAKRLSMFAEFVGGETPMERISAAMLRAYRAHLVKRGLSPHTVHGHQRALRRFFSWCLKERLITANPAADVPLVKLPQQPPKAISKGDFDRLLRQLPNEPPRDRAIVLLLADTGCRVGGLCSMSLNTLDLIGRSAMVVEKGNRARRVYYTPPTAQAIRDYLEVRPDAPTDALFITRFGQALTTNSVRLLLVRLGKRAGVRGRCNAHSFRHAFARDYLERGDLLSLQRILGHTPGSAVTAQYYAVWDDRELQRFHDRYSPLVRAAEYEDAGTHKP